ncbi:hypothetical protein LDFHOB_07250 [Candidatus Electronema aureum]
MRRWDSKGISVQTRSYWVEITARREQMIVSAGCAGGEDGQAHGLPLGADKRK